MTPEPARREVLDQAAVGRKPTTAQVKESNRPPQAARGTPPPAVGGTNSYREALRTIEPNVGAATIADIRKGKIRLATYEVKRIAELSPEQQVAAINLAAAGKSISRIEGGALVMGPITPEPDTHPVIKAVDMLEAAILVGQPSWMSCKVALQSHLESMSRPEVQLLQPSSARSGRRWNSCMRSTS